MKDMRQEFADTLLEVGKMDKNLMVMVGDISHFRLQDFAKACPGRYYNIGICEPTIVNMAAGLSKLGFYPVVHTIAPFIVERSYEQIKLDFCYQKLGANIITVGSAFDYSTLGCTHHCYVDFALLKPLPETQIFFPSSPIELNTLFKQTYNNGKLSYFRVPKLSHGYVFSQDKLMVGKGMVISTGKDITVVVTGPQLKTVLNAAIQLKKEGIDVEIIYIHTIKPFDEELVLGSINKTKRVFVIEEHSMYGGMGDEILRITRGMGGVKYSFISIPDIFIRDYGSYEDICGILGFTVENILKKVKDDLF
ncbi:MAG: transketolase C-terminal domain-containing protein [Candidatus Omnitrophica bacterium]|nr:transketolase C-terminal domain-containing protein [Candidatus Omnitrophota bacterium]